MTTTLATGTTYRLTLDGTPVRLVITGLTLWEVTFTVTGPGVRNPEKPRVMPVGAFARWLELAQEQIRAPPRH